MASLRVRGSCSRSNRSQLQYITTVLTAFGLGIRPITKPVRPLSHQVLTAFETLSEQMSEQEHGRWNVERLSAGWRYSPLRDPNNKRSPYIVPWVELNDRTKSWDRTTVRLWPEVLASLGYEIYLLSDPRT